MYKFILHVMLLNNIKFCVKVMEFNHFYVTLCIIYILCSVCLYYVLAHLLLTYLHISILRQYFYILFEPFDFYWYLFITNYEYLLSENFTKITIK